MKRRSHIETPRRSVGRRGAILLLMGVVFSAYLMALAVGVRPHPWLGLITLLPLLRAVQVLTPVGALACGAAWGMSLYGFASGMEMTAVAPGVGSFLLLTLIPAAYGYVGARITRRIGFSPFVLGVGWMLVECALRPLALRHGLLAGTQGDGWLVTVVGRAFGYVLVAFIVAFASAWLLAIISRIRLRITLPGLQLGLDEAGRWLWHVIPAGRPCFVPCPSRPRAPPVFA